MRHSRVFFEAAVEGCRLLGARAVLVSPDRDQIPERLPSAVQWVVRSRLAACFPGRPPSSTTAESARRPWRSRPERRSSSRRWLSTSTITRTDSKDWASPRCCRRGGSAAAPWPAPCGTRASITGHASLLSLACRSPQARKLARVEADAAGSSKAAWLASNDRRRGIPGGGIAPGGGCLLQVGMAPTGLGCASTVTTSPELSSSVYLNRKRESSWTSDPLWPAGPRSEPCDLRRAAMRLCRTHRCRARMFRLPAICAARGHTGQVGLGNEIDLQPAVRGLPSQPAKLCH